MYEQDARKGGSWNVVIDRTNRTLRVLVTLSCMAGVYIVSTVPEGDGTAGAGWLLASVSPNVQNLLHPLAYAGLALLWVWTLTGWRVRPWIAAISAIVIASLFGALLEIDQLWVPGRFASLGDGLLNVVGAILGTWLYVRWLKPR